MPALLMPQMPPHRCDLTHTPMQGRRAVNDPPERRGHHAQGKRQISAQRRDALTSQNIKKFIMRRIYARRHHNAALRVITLKRLYVHMPYSIGPRAEEQVRRHALYYIPVDINAARSEAVVYISVHDLMQLARRSRQARFSIYESACGAASNHERRQICRDNFPFWGI